MTITEIQEDIIEEFSVFDDWMDKYAYIIDLGNEMASIDEKKKMDQNLIQGCQSKVWIDASLTDGKIYFEADSNSTIVKGIVALLMKVYSGQSPDDILNHELTFINAIGLNQHLSPTRSNGLLSMIKQVKLYALAFQSKQ